MTDKEFQLEQQLRRRIVRDIPHTISHILLLDCLSALEDILGDMALESLSDEQQEALRGQRVEQIRSLLVRSGQL